VKWLRFLTALAVFVPVAARAQYPGGDEPTRHHKSEEERLQDRWLYSGNAKRGLVLAYGPLSVVEPQTMRNVDAVLAAHGDTPRLAPQEVEIGWRLARFPVKDALPHEWRLGARYAWASARAPDGTTARVDFPSIYAGRNWQLHPAATGLDFLHVRPQLYVPAEIQYTWTQVKISGKPYKALGFDVAAGVGARLYTLTPLAIDVSMRYRLGFGDPLNHRSMSNPDYLLTPSGKRIHGDPTGFEPRVGIEWLFKD
jgi:hypothetical protein